jgi:hypothetical protein
MRRQPWTVLRESDVSHYLLLACVETADVLYVVLAGPADPTLAQVLAHTPNTGDALVWRGQGPTVGLGEDVTVARFDPPPAGVDFLDVSVAGVAGFNTRLVRGIPAATYHAGPDPDPAGR